MSGVVKFLRVLNTEKANVCIEGEKFQDAACWQNHLPTLGENIEESRCVTVSFKGEILEEHSP